jgi:hypothetical protein
MAKQIRTEQEEFMIFARDYYQPIIVRFDNGVEVSLSI